MECAETLRVQAYFDGQVDAAKAFDMERHIDTCAECHRHLEELKQLRSLIRDNVSRAGMPTALRDRIAQSLDRESQAVAQEPRRRNRSGRRSHGFWIGVMSGVGGSLAAVALTFVAVSTLFNHRLLNDLVADHTHSLLTSHLIDVVSTDQHTVKPWFAGRTNVSPVVADFSPQGYRLLGGRVDDLNRQRVAVTVYQHGRHIINVFSWEIGAGAVPHNASRNGYHLAFWKSGDVAYSAVSDTGWSELQVLVRLLQEQAARNSAQP